MPAWAWFKTWLQAPAASLPNWRQICAVYSANRPWFLALHCTYTHEMCNAKKPAFEPCPFGGMVQTRVSFWQSFVLQFMLQIVHTPPAKETAESVTQIG